MTLSLSLRTACSPRFVTLSAALLLATATVTSSMGAQSSSSKGKVSDSVKAYIQKGDKATAERKGDDALQAYENALRLDSLNMDALIKGSNTAAMLAEFGLSARAKSELLSIAQKLALRAYGKDSTSAETHFLMAQAMGRLALHGGQMAQLKYSTPIYEQAQACLKIQPKHPGCNHVLGNWHFEVMRLSDFERRMATMMSGSKLLDSASWDKAISYSKAAITAEPKRAIHHILLGQIYQKKGDTAEAIAEFKATEAAPLTDFNDEAYKKLAADALKQLEAQSKGK